MLKEIGTRLILDGAGDLTVHRYQDAQDIADRAKMLREQPQHGDFHHKWSLPNVEVENFYKAYCGREGLPKPMNQEFWAWVHEKMKDPQYKVFWCHDPQFQFRVGYDGLKVSLDESK